MDTTYYTFQTRKVKVSGGRDMLTIVPTAVAAPASPAGEVLDFDRCRRKLETQAAWKGLVQAVAEVKAPDTEGSEDMACKAAVPTERAGSWLELCASVAVILVCLCAGWAFLALV